jgi:hypothetical protein
VQKSAALSSLPSYSNRKSNQLSNRASILLIEHHRERLESLALDSEVPVPKKAKAFEKTRAVTPMFGKGNEPRYSVAGKTHPFARFNEKVHKSRSPVRSDFRRKLDWYFLLDLCL